MCGVDNKDQPGEDHTRYYHSRVLRTRLGLKEIGTAVKPIFEMFTAVPISRSILMFHDILQTGTTQVLPRFGMMLPYMHVCPVCLNPKPRKLNP